MNIRHISIQRDHMGQEIERLELEGEARTLEELEASFKQLPQTPLVKSWSAAVTSELKEQLTPDAWAASGLQTAEAPYSSQSSASDKTDASSSPEQPSGQVSETPQSSEIQLPTALQAQALLRGIHSYITSLLEQPNEFEKANTDFGNAVKRFGELCDRMEQPT